MKTTAKIVSLISLVFLVVPSIMYLAGSMELDRMKLWMIIATVVWFVCASVWMWQSDSNSEQQQG